MIAKNKSLTEIHLAVFLFGASGLFGKFLSLPSIVIVTGRVFFSSGFLLLLLISLKKDIKLKEKKHYFYLLIMGIILAIHWTTFFQSIQVSTAAIGLITFSTFPVFVTFLGVVLVVPKFELESNLTQGAFWGILSGFAYAILSMLNRKYVKEYSRDINMYIIIIVAENYIIVK